MRKGSAWSGSSLRTMALLGLMLLAITVGGLSRTRQTAAKSAQPQEAKAKPGAAEMKRLGFYPGEWTYTETYPNGAVNHGTYTSKLGPGGNSLLNTFHSQGPVGDFEGMLVYTWDLAEGKYKAYVFGNDFPGHGSRQANLKGKNWCCMVSSAAGPPKSRCGTLHGCRHPES